MASIEIYEPICEKDGCGARATRRLRTEAGTFHFYCTKDSGPALIAANKAERERGKGQVRQ